MCRTSDVLTISMQLIALVRVQQKITAELEAKGRTAGWSNTEKFHAENRPGGTSKVFNSS